MKYLIVLGAFLIITAILYILPKKFLKSRKSIAWFRIVTFNLTFCITTLIFFYFLGFRWYLYIVIPIVNLLLFYLSAKILFERIIFNRRSIKNE